jgi:pimeloyl-ACP methyl ester carboxylesterase
MGGDIILEAALKRPSKVIALVGVDNFKDVGVEYSDQEQEDMKGFMEMLQQDFANIAPAYAEGMLFHRSTDSLVAARVMNDFRKADPSIAVASLQNLFDYSSKEREKLGVLKQKLYLINSDATPTNVEGLGKTGIDYEVNYIHATGHYPMVEKPEEFNQIMLRILNKIEVAEEGN